MKIDRMVSIIMILLNKKKVSAQELADTFEVSKRTIYRDIDSICLAGIPIRATSGVGGGFEIMPDYKIDKKVFSEDDLSVLLMGLSSLSNVVHRDELIHTISKVKSFIPSHQAENIALRSNQISIDMDPWINNPSIKSNLAKIELALQKRNLISFSYINHRNNMLTRTVEPYQLVSKNGNWYIYGFCQLRKDYRLFKLSRIIDLTVTDTIFTAKDFPNPQLDATDIAKSQQITITLRIHRSLMERLLDYCPYDQFEPDGESNFIVHFPFIDRDYYYDMLLGFGDKCECIEPLHVREKLHQKVMNLNALYK